MRLIFALALIASPAIADEVPFLDRGCMALLGPSAYGAETYGNGIMTGIVIGYGIAHGYALEEPEEIGDIVAEACRDGDRLTVREALAALDQD